MKKILVIDIGGTHVKMMISPTDKRKFDSGPKMAAKDFVTQVKSEVADWKYDAISIGFPAVVEKGQVRAEPTNLRKGWIGFNFARALGKPVRVINDAAMQALGSYRSGRMLFLGLGTGLGSTLIWGKNVMPLELGRLPFGDGEIEDVLGNAGLQQLGEKQWRKGVMNCIARLKAAFIADHVVIGGGNARLLGDLPEGFELGHNRLAYRGGCRLWETDVRSRKAKWNVL